MVLNFNGYSVEIDEAAERYNEIRKEFTEMSRKAKDAAIDCMNDNFKSYTDFANNAKSAYEDLFNSYLQKTVWKLVEHKIYNVDEVVLLQLFEERFELKYKKKLNSMLSIIIGIDLARAEAKAENSDRTMGLFTDSLSATADSSLSLMTGDAGGYLGSSMEAGVDLMGSLASAGFSFASNKIGEHNDNIKKKEVFESSFDRSILYDGFEEDVYNLNFLFADIVNGATNEVVYKYPLDDVVDSFEPICRNIMAGNYLKDASQPNLEKDMIEQILSANPYEKKVYSYVVKKNSGMSEDMKSGMLMLGVDLADLANTYVKYSYGVLKFKTYEEACEVCDKVKEQLVSFGVETCGYYEQLCSQKEELYKKRRTFRGYVFDTIEERDDAEVKYNAFMEEFEISTLEIDELIAVFYETYTRDLYDGLRGILRSEIMNYVEGKLKNFKEFEKIEPYFEEAQSKCTELGVESTSLFVAIEKVYKKLKVKQKIGNAFGSAKDKSKELFSKVPFGKKNAEEGTESQPIAESQPAATAQPEAAAEAPKESKFGGFGSKFSSGMGMAKGMFGKGKDEGTAAEAEPETKPCPSCGNQVKATGKFCSKCGYRF